MSNKPFAFTTIEEARRWASVFLREHQRETKVADLLLEHYLNISFAMLLAYGADPFPEEKRQPFKESVAIHAKTGKPVQQIIGYADFYGRPFKVNQDVLIPRPETEELVAGVLDWLARKTVPHPAIVDLGTGSGAIALTLALEFPSAKLSAVDLSERALEVARENAEHLDATATFFQGDFLQPVRHQQIDVIVSNPPYIPYEEKSEIGDTVLNFDPSMALFAKENGLAAYHTIVNQIVKYQMNPKLIAFEIGHQQGGAVKEIMEKALSSYQVEIRKDINKKDRMIFATRSK